MSWVEIFVVFLLSHFVGDYLLQTDWEARNKRGGLSRRNLESRRALVTHVTTYTLAFIPAGIWLHRLGGGLALLALGIFVPHLIQDDGRVLMRYVRLVKGDGAASNQTVFAQVDQTFHFLVLFATAIVVHATLP